MNIDNIKNYIDDPSFISDIILKKSVTSTNTLLKDMAGKSCPQWTVMVAEKQTAGRGRLGRAFHSPENTGIYFSILLRPDAPACESLFLTTAAAVAVAKAIENISSEKAKIKWVNDIYIEEKKVCGILTEGSVSADGKLDYAIVGVGINIINPADNFPEELKSIAGAILEHDNTYTNENYITTIKERLVGEFLNYFKYYYSTISERTFFEEYKERSFLIGRQIYVIEKENQLPATVLDIDDNCQLVVRFHNGQIRHLSSGEVSTKLF